jgi:mannose-1-phosphate guanylyltransferase
VRINHGKDLKCLILCAGLGTRLKPLTLILPKPMATVFNVPLFDIALRACASTESVKMAINTHHLPDLMTQHAQTVAENLSLNKLHISHESPAILGTGGALCQLSGWWGESDLLIYNGDVLSDIPLSELSKQHQASANLVTLAVRKEPPRDGGRSIWLDENGLVRHIAKRSDLPPQANKLQLREVGFACAYVVSSDFRQYLPRDPQFFDVVDGFNRAIADGRQIGAIYFSGLWADVGTPKSLWETNLNLARLGEAERHQLLGASSRVRSPVPSTCKVDTISVIADDVTFGPNATITKSVLLPGAVVQAGENLSGCLRGLGFNESFEG